MPKKKTPDLFKVHKPQFLKAADLSPAAYNPNQMSPGKFEALKESIQRDGFLDPIVVQKRGLNIIGGHHRWRAIKELCVEAGVAVPTLPCVVVDVDDMGAKRLNLKLNHIKGEPDARLLGELLVDLYPVDIQLEEMQTDIPMLGLEFDDALKYARIADPEFHLAAGSGGGGTSSQGFGRSITVSLEFDSIQMRDKVRKVLQDQAALEKKKTGDIVAGLLGIGRKRRSRARNGATKQTRAAGDLAHVWWIT